jgi:hypothetical protein
MTTSLVEWAPSKTYLEYIPIPAAGMRVGADLQLTLT